MTRFRVFQWRLAVTMVVFLLFFAVARLLWYPGLYFAISGTAKLVLILLGVILVTGPGLTTLIFKPGKWGLGFDIRALAIVEILVLIVAGSMMYEGRPYYVVFAVDRFEVVTIAEVDRKSIRFDEHRNKPLNAPRIVYAELPKDPEEHSRLMDEVVFQGRKDIDRRPEFWRPYANGIQAVRAKSSPLSSLLESNDERSQPARKWLSQQAGKVDEYSYLPLRGKVRDMAMVLQSDVDLPVGIIDVDPW
jgi:hypothetical protein